MNVTDPEGATTVAAAADRPILSVRDLEKWFALPRSPGEWLRRHPTARIRAVDGVSLDLLPNEILGVVGESGSGKSTLARCLVSLYRADAGRIVLDGEDVTNARGARLRAVYRRVQMVFQDPYTSLNPRMTIGSAILEAGRVHGRVDRGTEQRFVHHLLDLVGLPSTLAERRPHALSGGQRQRAAIARALAVEPQILIADEAVSALDVSIQAQILNLFEDLVRGLHLSLIFIAHDLAVVSHLCDRVATMYLGRVVEQGPVDRVFRRPQHPYTRALLAAHPEPGIGLDQRPPSLRGDIPSPAAVPTGCRFRTRCEYAVEACTSVDPPLEPVAGGHAVACPVRPFAAADR